MKQWLLNIRQPGKRYTVWEGIRRILPSTRQSRDRKSVV